MNFCALNRKLEKTVNCTVSSLKNILKHSKTNIKPKKKMIVSRWSQCQNLIEQNSDLQQGYCCVSLCGCWSYLCVSILNIISRDYSTYFQDSMKFGCHRPHNLNQLLPKHFKLLHCGQRGEIMQKLRQIHDFHKMLCHYFCPLPQNNFLNRGAKCSPPCFKTYYE